MTLGNNRVTGRRRLQTDVRPPRSSSAGVPTTTRTCATATGCTSLGDSESGSTTSPRQARWPTITGVYDAAGRRPGHSHALPGHRRRRDLARSTRRCSTASTPGSQAPLIGSPSRSSAGSRASSPRSPMTSDQVVALTSGGDVVGVDLPRGQEAGRIIYPDRWRRWASRRARWSWSTQQRWTIRRRWPRRSAGLIDRDAYAIEARSRERERPRPGRGLHRRRPLATSSRSRSTRASCRA